MLLAKMKLFVIAFLICSFAVDQTEADVSSILSHLSSKAITALKNVKIPVLNAQVGIIRSHIRSLLSFFRGREGDIPITNTEFVLHFVADRCHLIGKRFLMNWPATCKAYVTEVKTGLRTICVTMDTNESIVCALKKMADLLKQVALKVQQKKTTGNML